MNYTWAAIVKEHIERSTNRSARKSTSSMSKIFAVQLLWHSVCGSGTFETTGFEVVTIQRNIKVCRRSPLQGFTKTRAPRHHQCESQPLMEYSLGSHHGPDRPDSEVRLQSLFEIEFMHVASCQRSRMTLAAVASSFPSWSLALPL